MTTPATKPVPTTPAATPATPDPKATAPEVKPAGDPAAAPTPAKAARLKLDEVTAERKRLKEEREAAEAAKAAAEPLTKRAQEFEAKLARLADDPAGFLEEIGVDRNAVTEKLAAKAIEDVKAKSPDGRIDALQAEIKALRDADAKSKADAEAAEHRKALDASIADYKKTLVDALDATKYPLTAKAARAEFGDKLADALWDVGGSIFRRKAAGKTAEEADKLPAPTPTEILDEMEARYKKIADGIAAREEADPKATTVPAPAKPRTPEEIKAAAEERRKAKEPVHPKSSNPTGAIVKPPTTIAERKAAVRAAMAKK